MGSKAFSLRANQVGVDRHLASRICDWIHCSRICPLYCCLLPVEHHHNLSSLPLLFIFIRALHGGMAFSWFNLLSTKTIRSHPWFLFLWKSTPFGCHELRDYLSSQFGLG